MSMKYFLNADFGIGNSTAVLKKIPHTGIFRCGAVVLPIGYCVVVFVVGRVDFVMGVGRV